MNSLLSQISDITGTDTDECFDVTMYLLGAVENTNYQILYADLTDEEKATVIAFRDLLKSKAPIV